jgi:hypothetical protein
MDMTPGRRVTLAVCVPVALALIGWGGLTAAAAVGTGQRTFATSLPVSDGTMTLDIPGGDVMVAAGDAARLTGTLRYSLVSPDLTVNRSGVFYRCEVPAGSCDMTATMTVPSSVHSVDLSSRGGDLTFTGGITDNTTLATSGGDITASGLTGTAHLDSEGGDITASGITASDVLASATGGDITLTFTKAPRYVHVTSGGGDITIVVPPGNYLFNATAYGGSASAPASDPGATDVVTATAVGGDITITES